MNTSHHNSLLDLKEDIFIVEYVGWSSSSYEPIALGRIRQVLGNVPMIEGDFAINPAYTYSGDCSASMMAHQLAINPIYSYTTGFPQGSAYF